MDFIAQTNEFNKVKSQYQDLIRNNFNEDSVREIIASKCITDDIYNRLEQVNVYNDFDEAFIGKYDVEFFWNGEGESYDLDLFYITGYYWNEDLSGTQTDRKKKPIKFNVFEFLDDINNVFTKLIK